MREVVAITEGDFQGSTSNCPFREIASVPLFEFSVHRIVYVEHGDVRIFINFHAPRQLGALSSVNEGRPRFIDL